MAEAGLKIAFIGCGNMGGAILDGLLNATSVKSPTIWGTIKLIACTRSEASARKLGAILGQRSSRVEVLFSQNVRAMKEADVIILGCKPYMAREVLSEQAVRDAVQDKLVVSMLAGLSAGEVRQIIVGQDTAVIKLPHVIRAIPNIAARYCQSTTILETPDPALPPRLTERLEWIFKKVGQIKYLPPNQVNAGSVLVTCSLASLSVAIEGLLDGSVIEGLRRSDAMELALQGVQGLATVLQNGIHPAAMRESISSPGGCTIQSLLTVEKAATRAVFAQAIVDGTRHLQSSNSK